MNTHKSELGSIAQNLEIDNKSDLFEKVIKRDVELSILRLNLERTFHTDTLALTDSADDDLLTIKLMINSIRSDLNLEDQDEWFCQIRFAIWDVLLQKRNSDALSAVIAKDICLFIKKPSSAIEDLRKSPTFQCSTTGIKPQEWFTSGVTA